jgi:hypothetical protein
MFLSYFTLAVALSLSVIAAWYSIIGLTAIFASAVIPIIVMGTMLEVAKVTVTVWLHEYWHRCRWVMKLYLVPAVIMLMLITSMGIFGFLSKAHSDQSIVSGDAAAKIAIYDEKIKTAKENIEANRKALKQMDESVDQVLGRSQDEKGADKAVGLRRSQQKERARLQSEISAEQKTIATLNEERAPIAADVRKVEAEVGPIKYIASLIYGDNPDANLLERAVRWMIVILVVVFDPLAIMMVLAATESIKWRREDREFEKALETKREVAQALDRNQDLPVPTTVVETPDESPPPEPELAYLKEGHKMFFRDLKPMVAQPNAPQDTEEFNEDLHDDHPSVKQAIKAWKEQNPDRTLKEQRAKLARGEISELPWMALIDNAELEPPPRIDFGTEFPIAARKGDTFMRVDRLPNELYKFNGTDWMAVDKNLTDSYTYETAYLDYLIEALEKGQYELDHLNDSEREQIARRLSETKSNNT